MRNGDLCTVIIYKDNVVKGCDEEDNTVYLTLKTKVLMEWYRKFLLASSRHPDLSVEEQFNIWLTQEYTADDTDGLFSFAKQRGGVVYLESLLQN